MPGTGSASDHLGRAVAVLEEGYVGDLPEVMLAHPLLALGGVTCFRAILGLF